MKDKIYYYDRNNVLQLTLNEYPYYSEPSDLKDWIWGYNEQFGKINSFRREKKEYELVIGIAGDYLYRHDVLCDIFSAEHIRGHLKAVEAKRISEEITLMHRAYSDVDIITGILLLIATTHQ